MKTYRVIKHLVSLVVGGLSIGLIVIALITQSQNALATADNWQMFQHDPQHTGRSLQIGPQTANVRWNFSTEGVPGSPAVNNDGTIYLPIGLLNTDTTGALYAINPDGSLQWRLPLNILPSSTAPAIGPDGTVYVHGNGDEANILAIEKLIAVTPGGAVAWAFKFNDGGGSLTDYVQSSPTIGADGTIYVGSKDTNLYALNPNGTIKWARTPSLSGIASSPALAPDGHTIYVVDSSTTIFAYSSAGVLQWRYSLSDPAIGTANDQSPSVGTDGTIYVGSPDEYLYAINPNGTLKWRFQTGSRIRSTPAIGADGVIYVGSDSLYAINPDGTQKWKFATSLFSSASPILGGDGLVYWRESFKAYAVNPNGIQKWSLSLWPFSAAALDSTPTIGPDGTLYLPTAKFFADGENGLRAYAPAATPTVTPTLSPTSTPTPTNSPTPTTTPSSTATPTNTPVNTAIPPTTLSVNYLPLILRPPSSMPTVTPTPTFSPMPIATPTVIRTPLPEQIAFVSERDGNSEIYTMNTDGSGVTRLTNNEEFDGSPCWSPVGTQIAFSSYRDNNYEIYLMNADGSGLINLTNNPADDYGATWSPDGARIAFASDRDGNNEIYVMNVDGSALTRLTNNPALEAQPDWSPDGTRLAFISDRDGANAIYVMNADGSGQTRLTEPSTRYDYPAWSPDGTKIAFAGSIAVALPEGIRIYQVGIMNAEGSGQTPITDIWPTIYNLDWSPDSTRLVFTSYRGRNGEIYVANIDGSGQINLTNHLAFDRQPAWRH